jgi:hypothetical protein
MEWLLTRLLSTLTPTEAIYFVGVLNEYMRRVHPRKYAHWVTAGLNEDVARLVTGTILDHLHAARAWREVAEVTGVRWLLTELLAALEQDEAIYFVGEINVHMCREHPDEYARWVIGGLPDSGVHLLTDMMLGYLQVTHARQRAAFTVQRKRDVLHQVGTN